MHLDSIPSILVSLAGTAVGSFVVAVTIDNVFGVLLALRERKFDWNKLPSFLLTQYGTKQAIALGGLAVTAYLTGGDIRTAVLTAVTAGGGALTLSVLADVFTKVKILVAPGLPLTA